MTRAIAFRIDGGQLVYLVDGNLHIPLKEIGSTRLKLMALFHPKKTIPVVEYGGRRYVPLMWAQQLFSKKDWSNWQLFSTEHEKCTRKLQRSRYRDERGV